MCNSVQHTGVDKTVVLVMLDMDPNGIWISTLG